MAYVFARNSLVNSHNVINVFILILKPTLEMPEQAHQERNQDFAKGRA